MHWLRAVLLLATVLSIAGPASCQYRNSETVKATYVGTIERSIRLIMKSGRMINEGIATVREDLRGMALNIPFLRSRALSNRTTIADIFNPFKSRIKAIVPGTYWCGDGDISPNKKELGLFEKTDACCRGHDSCPDGIPAQQERDGLLNNGIFTRSSCECDLQFYNCLKAVNNILASNIGATYFDGLRPQCFRKAYPIMGCKKYAGRRLLNDKCEEYIYDTTQAETMEWFDNPDFLALL